MADATASRTVAGILTAKRGQGKLHWTDVFSYVYLVLGVCLMFGPVVWLVLSSFKTQAGLQEFPPTLLPLGQIEVQVEQDVLAAMELASPSIAPVVEVFRNDTVTSNSAAILSLGVGLFVACEGQRVRQGINLHASRSSTTIPYRLRKAPAERAQGPARHESSGTVSGAGWTAQAGIRNCPPFLG